MQVLENISLLPFNTFGIDAKAKLFVEASSADELRTLMQQPVFTQEKRMVLGGGSNILLTKDFDGLVLHNALRGITVVAEETQTVLVRAAAGEEWHALVLWCIVRNYAGIENMSLIPGLVGAAPMQNIGAYGVEVKDVFHSLEAIDLASGETVTMTATDCAFGYRESVFKHSAKGRYFITAVTLRLTDLNRTDRYLFHTDYGDIKATLAERSIFDLSIKAVSDAVCHIRQSKLPDPRELGNAGSFFKNPVLSAEQFAALTAVNPLVPSFPQADGSVKVPAGWLIEQCGWKGKRVGNTGSHARQALVLVNYGHATGAEVLQLATDIQASVRQKFGVEILPEVNVV